MAAVIGEGAAGGADGRKPAGKGELGKKYAGIPLWGWGLGAGVVFGAVVLLRRRGASSSTGTPLSYTPVGGGPTAPAGGGGGGLLPGGGAAPGTNPGGPTGVVRPPGVSGQGADGGQVASSYELPKIGSEIPGFGTVLNAYQGTGPSSAPSNPATLAAWNAAQATPPQALIGGPGSSLSGVSGGEYTVYGGGVQGTGALTPGAKRIAGERYDTSGRVIL